MQTAENGTVAVGTVTVLLTNAGAGYRLTPAGRDALKGRPGAQARRAAARAREAMKAAANAEYARELAAARAECDGGRISVSGFVDAMRAAGERRDRAFRAARAA